jgi:conjugal transfer mating pair stabilization protein TraN
LVVVYNSAGSLLNGVGAAGGGGGGGGTGTGASATSLPAGGTGGSSGGSGNPAGGAGAKATFSYSAGTCGVAGGTAGAAGGTGVGAGGKGGAGGGSDGYGSSYNGAAGTAGAAGTVTITFQADANALPYEDQGGCLSQISRTTGATPGCRQDSESCSDATAHVVNGVSIPASSVGGCWAYTRSYTCVEASPADYCAGLRNVGCTEVGNAGCAGGYTAFNGTCLGYLWDYYCYNKTSSSDPGVYLIADSYTIVQDAIDASQCSSYTQNTSCALAQETCTSGAATYWIEGVAVYKDCWAWSRNYSCVAANPVDYCAAIRSISTCSQINDVCIESAPANMGGSCMKREYTFNCTGALDPPPANTVLLNTSYTITSESISNVDYCAAVAANPSCTAAATVCSVGPGTRIINGVSIYRDCWEYRQDYTCLAYSSSYATNYCTPFLSYPLYYQCQKYQTSCVTWGLAPYNNYCTGYYDYYNCNSTTTPRQGVTYLNSSYTVTSDTVNSSACLSYANNPTCMLAGHTCTVGPGTRYINGLAVYRDCWEWKDEYTCASTTMTSNCGQFTSNPKCSVASSQCIDTSDTTGQCTLREYIYKCQSQDAQSSTVSNCGAQQFCIDGACFGANSAPDSDFARVAAAVEASRVAGAYAMFSGEPRTCRKTLGSLGDCCKTTVVAASNQSLAQQAGVAAVRFGAEAIKVYGSYYLYDALMAATGGALGFTPLASMLSGAAAGGNLTLYGFEFSISATQGVTFVGFDPYSLALVIGMYILNDLLSCTDDEARLSMARGQRLCYKVGGGYCSYKVLGMCSQKTDAYCCFPSRLARIINEQGRTQVGKDWGSNRFPDCSGFTDVQLKQLKFDQMNLSEFIAEITSSALSKSSGFAVQRANAAAASYFAQ